MKCFVQKTNYMGKVFETIQLLHLGGDWKGALMFYLINTVEKCNICALLK